MTIRSRRQRDRTIVRSRMKFVLQVGTLVTVLPLLKSHSRAGLPQKTRKTVKKKTKKLALKLATFSLKTRKNLHKFSKKLAKNRLCLFVRRCIFSYLSLFQFGLGIKDRKTKMKLKLTRYAIQGNSEF